MLRWSPRLRNPPYFWGWPEVTARADVGGKPCVVIPVFLDLPCDGRTLSVYVVVISILLGPI